MTRPAARLAAAVVVVGVTSAAWMAFEELRFESADTALCREIASDVGLQFDNPYGPVTATDDLGIMMQRNMGNGAAVGDYDGDGDLDVYLLSNAGHPAALFRNRLEQGSLAFEDATEEAGVADEGLGRVAHFADLDGDDDLDLLVLNDRDPDGVLPPSRLFRNDGDGNFTDVGSASGLQPVGYLIGGAALADYDLDGDLDVFVTMWTREIGGTPIGAPLAGRWPGNNALYENRGEMTFVDVTSEVGLDPLRLDSFTSVFHDFDGDDDLDLYVAVDHREDRFYEQTAVGFVDASSPALVNHVGNDMGIAAGDISGDGLIDLFVTNINDRQQLFGVDPPGNTLLVSEMVDGQVRFRDQARTRGVDDVGWGWGAVFTDADLDGDLDLYAVQGFDEFVGAEFELYDRESVLFENDGTGTFSARADGSCAVPGDQRALVAFDADRDHDPDYLITQVDRPTLLLENQASGRGLTVVLNAAPAAGAVVEARVGPETVTQLVMAGGSYLTGAPAEAYIGLGDETAAAVTVRWADGHTTDLGIVKAGEMAIAVR